MAKIYRLSDRIKVQITAGGEKITLKLAPLSQHVKAEAQTMMINSQARGNAKQAVDAIQLVLRHSLKGIEGLEDSDGKAYELQFENEALTDKCLEELFNVDIDLNSKIMLVCSNMVNGVPKVFKDDKNQVLPDIEILGDSAEKK